MRKATAGYERALKLMAKKLASKRPKNAKRPKKQAAWIDKELGR